jgi:AhpD family alkylhydroperoxidase
MTSDAGGPVPLRRPERVALVPPLTRDQWSPEAEAAMDLLPPNMQPAAGQTINSLSVLAQHPPLAAAYLRFSLYLRFGSTLDGRTREMLILRTAWLRHAEYELLRHARLARRHGLSDEEIASIAVGSQAPRWTRVDSLLQLAVEELCGEGRVTPATWSELCEHFSLQEMMDIVFTVGAYDMLTMAFNTFGVEPEPDLPPFPQLQ